MTASRLRVLQRDVQRYVDEPAAPRAATWMRHVVDSGGVGAARRLGIYADGYRLRLIEALEADYPAVRHVAGETSFERWARGFIDDHPSRHPNLRWYGADFAGWLRRAAPRRPALAELAGFEWAVGLAFDAADAPVITVDDLARVSPQLWPGLSFSLHPAVQRLTLWTNAPALWAAAETGLPLRARRGDRATTWAVWRRELMPRYRTLPAVEAWALGAAARGRNFAQLCAGVCRWVPEAQAPLRAATLLRTWVVEGMVSAVLTQ
ncbi:MAG: putative DNA-binding domain-containing protein [Ramlibacter sp.]|nr:putative DNA-binding domain-containing protein [Ramlibacter sp.]